MTFTIIATTFALEAREGDGESGTAVVCVDARYVAALWRGDARRTRVAVSAAEWRVLTAEIALVSPGSVVDRQAPLSRLVTEGRALMRCVAVTELKAEPLGLTAVLDALLGPC